MNAKKRHRWWAVALVLVVGCTGQRPSEGLTDREWLDQQGVPTVVTVVNGRLVGSKDGTIYAKNCAVQADIQSEWDIRLGEGGIPFVCDG